MAGETQSSEKASERCVRAPAALPMVVVREEYVGICNGDPCAAALLNYFEHWTNYKLKNEHTLENVWIYISQVELPAELMNIFTLNEIKVSLKLLRELGYLSSRKRQQHSWNQQLQYQLDVDAVQASIDHWFYTTNAEVVYDHSTGQYQLVDKSHATNGVVEGDQLNGQQQPLSTEIPLQIPSLVPTELPAAENGAPARQSAAAAGNTAPRRPASLSEIFQILEGGTPAAHGTPTRGSAPPPPSQQNVFELYSANIGELTPILREQLLDACNEFGEEKVKDAVREAVFYNARSWAYMDAIMKRWRRNFERARAGLEPEEVPLLTGDGYNPFQVVGYLKTGQEVTAMMLREQPQLRAALLQQRPLN